MWGIADALEWLRHDSLCKDDISIMKRNSSAKRMACKHKHAALHSIALLPTLLLHRSGRLTLMESLISPLLRS